MKAVWFEKVGDAARVLIYGERELPLPADGEVLVRLRATAVNPSDVKKRAGLQPSGLEANPFVIPHSDGAGVIEAVGGGVPSARVGERVWVYQAQYQRHLGTAAEYVALPAARACPLPVKTSFNIGACLGIPAMTAHRCVFVDRDRDAKREVILVSGAAGRVGFYAAQMAKLSGARVIGTAGGEARAKLAAQAGCDLVLDYKDGDEAIAAAVAEFTGGAGVDRIVEAEFGLNLARNCKLLKANGVIASYASSGAPEPTLPFYLLMFNNIALRLVLVYGMPEPAKQRAATDINTWLEADKLTHRLAKPHDLTEVAAAHALVEAGGGEGCVVLDIE